MKDLLLNKLDSWTIEEVTNRHKIDNPLTHYLWDSTPEGSFLYRNDGINAVHFFTKDGQVHKITDRFTESDFDNLQRLYQLSQTSSNFRMDVPVSNELFVHNGRAYSYTVVERPNKEHGDRIFNKIFNQTLTSADLLQYVDDVEILLTHLKSLNCLLPDVGLDMVLQAKDSVGHYWTDFKIWDRPYTDFVNKTIDLFKASVATIGAQVGTIDQATIIQTAETKWKAI